MKVNRVIIHADGASVGNPGPAAIGATIKDDQGRILASVSQRIGTATNNQAEYRAVIAALEKATKLGANWANIYLDSELVVKQLNGQYRVRNRSLKPLYHRAKQLQGLLRGSVVNHIPRHENSEAHNLAHKALNLIASIMPAERCRLVITITQASDEASNIAYLHKLIDALKNFPGQDEISLRVIDEEKVIRIKLANIFIDYCPELRQRLVKLVGEKGLKVEAAD